MRFGLRHTLAFVITIAALVLTSMPAQARRFNDKLLNRPYADMKLIHLGFSVGGYFQSYSFTHNGYITDTGQQWGVEMPSLAPGFCVNMLVDLRLHQYFNLRLSPGMYFGASDIRMRDYSTGDMLRQNLKSAYVVVPLDLKVSGDRLGNSRPYFTVGAMGSFDVSKRRSDYLWPKVGAYYLTVGLGVDLYMPFFKLNPEIKFCFGLNDILKRERPDLVDDPETMKITDSLSKMKSNMCVITFYFE